MSPEKQQELSGLAAGAIAALAELDPPSDHPMRHHVRALRNEVTQTLEMAFCRSMRLADLARQVLDDHDKAVAQAVDAERTRCALICRSEADGCEQAARHAQEHEPDEVSALRSTAWKLTVAEERIKKGDSLPTAIQGEQR